MLENKCASFASDGIGDAARAAQWNSAEIEPQTNPVIIRTIGFKEIDPVPPAKSPEPPRAKQINSAPERHRYQPCAEFTGFGVHLTIWIADKPCLMPMSIQPIDLKTGAVFLAAPAAAALYVENVHVESATIAVTAI